MSKNIVLILRFQSSQCLTNKRDLTNDYFCIEKKLDSMDVGMA